MKTISNWTFAAILLVLIVLPLGSANAEWWLREGGDDILLVRTDQAVEAPLQRPDAGSYGYNSVNFGWVNVFFINSTGIVPLAPYSLTYLENNLQWKPGSQDWIPQP